MNCPRRNPFTPAASCIFVVAFVLWLAVLLAVAGGSIAMPWWVAILVCPTACTVVAFFLWLSWMLAATAYYRVLACFAHQQRPPRQ